MTITLNVLEEMAATKGYIINIEETGPREFDGTISLPDNHPDQDLSLDPPGGSHGIYEDVLTNLRDQLLMLEDARLL